jgi:hypothetical protein
MSAARRADTAARRGSPGKSSRPSSARNSRTERGPRLTFPIGSEIVAARGPIYVHTDLLAAAKRWKHGHNGRHVLALEFEDDDVHTWPLNQHSRMFMLSRCRVAGEVSGEELEDALEAGRLARRPVEERR